MKERKPFFLRQHIKMSPKAKPSNDPTKIRLTFLERPYRFFQNSKYSYKAVIIALVLSVVVPVTMYNGINMLIGREYKAREQVKCGNDFFETYEILENSKKRK